MEPIRIPGLEPIIFDVPNNKGEIITLKNFGTTKKMMLMSTELSNLTGEDYTKSVDLMLDFLSLFFGKEKEFLEENFSIEMLSIIFVKAGEAIVKRSQSGKNGTGKKEDPIEGQNMQN